MSNEKPNFDIDNDLINVKPMPFESQCGSTVAPHLGYEGDNQLINCQNEADFSLHHEDEPDGQVTSMIACEDHFSDAVEFLELLADEENWRIQDD
jgi:uncharacterized cupredoxin-like copper-binding protein